VGTLKNRHSSRTYGHCIKSHSGKPSNFRYHSVLCQYTYSGGSKGLCIMRSSYSTPCVENERKLCFLSLVIWPSSTRLIEKKRLPSAFPVDHGWFRFSLRAGLICKGLVTISERSHQARSLWHRLLPSPYISTAHHFNGRYCSQANMDLGWKIMMSKMFGPTQNPCRGGNSSGNA